MDINNNSFSPDQYQLSAGGPRVQNHPLLVNQNYNN